MLPPALSWLLIVLAVSLPFVSPAGGGDERFVVSFNDKDFTLPGLLRPVVLRHMIGVRPVFGTLTETERRIIPVVVPQVMNRLEIFSNRRSFASLAFPVNPDGMPPATCQADEEMVLLRGMRSNMVFHIDIQFRIGNPLTGFEPSHSLIVPEMQTLSEYVQSRILAGWSEGRISIARERDTSSGMVLTFFLATAPDQPSSTSIACLPLTTPTIAPLDIPMLDEEYCRQQGCSSWDLPRAS